MPTIKVALLGFGTVGEGVYKTIQTHQDKLQATLGNKIEIVAVLIKNKEKFRDIDKNILVTTDFEEILRLPQLDIVMEAIVGREPGFRYLKKAMRKGLHVITANKEMFAHHGGELLELAGEEGVSVAFEAAVAGGVPIIQTVDKLLNVNRIEKIEGILNGTSNFILTEMRDKQLTFDEALSIAQAKGYAEADPTNDVQGIDAFYKLMILSQLAFGSQPAWEVVEREGIAEISSDKIANAEQAGLRYKHVASICRNENGSLVGSVQPVLVPKNHSFYHVEGVENAIRVTADIVGCITLQGPGAGMFPTASAMVEDIVHIVQSAKNRPQKLKPKQRISV